MTKKLLVAFLALVLCFSVLTLTACGTTAIAEIQASGKDGATYSFEGVVFAKDSKGFYVNQEQSSLYVVSDQQVNVGDLVKVKGTLALEGAYEKPVVTATKLSVKESGQTALTPSQSSIQEVLDITANRNGYYKYSKVSGFVRAAGTGYELTLPVGSVKLTFTAESNTYLSAWVDKQVDINVINVARANGVWQVSVPSAEDVSLHVVDFEGVKGDIFAFVDQQVVDSVYFKLALPTTYVYEPFVQFAWTVESGNSITVTDNVATVTPTATETVTLKLTLSYEGQTATQNYEVKVEVPEAKTFTEVTTSPADVVVKVAGTVFAVTHSQTKSACSVVLMDENKDLLHVVVESEDALNSINKGDQLVAVGAWAVDSMGIGSFEAVESFVTAPASQDYVTSLEGLDVITLATEADYIDFLTNWQAYATAGTVVKIVNPYVIYSGNTSYNFIRFGYDAAAGSAYEINLDQGEGKDPLKVSRIFCFQINALEREVPGLEAFLNVPFLNKVDAVKREMVIYAMPLYAGADTLQFSIIDKALIEDADKLVQKELDETFASKDIPAKSAGVLELPTAALFADGAITWETNAPDLFDVATGAYQAVTEDREFTLTASYTVNGQAKTYTLTFIALSKDRVPMTVTEAKQATAEDLAFNGLKAYVAAFGSDSNSQNNEGKRTGYYLTDGVNVLWVATTNYTVGDNTLALYDEVLIEKPVIEGNVLTGGTVSKILSNNNKIEYNLANVVTIRNEADLVAWASQVTPAEGIVLKFEGPFFMVGTGASNNSACRWQLNYRDAAGSTAARYHFDTISAADADDKTLAFKAMDGLLVNEWWLAANMPQAAGSASYRASGSFYAVSGTWGNTLWAFNFIDADSFALREWNEQETAEYTALNEVLALGTDVTAEAVGTYTLPASTTSVSALAWELVTTMEGLSISEGVLSFPAVDEDTVITLKASYTVGEATCAANVDFTLKAKVLEPSTIAQALALENGSEVKLQEVIGSFGAQSSTGEGDGFQRGLVLTDGTNVVYVADLGKSFRNASKQYEISGHALVIGDKVEVVGTITDGVVTATKISVISQTATTPSWKAANVTINNQAELVAYQPTAKIGDVVKFVATTENPIFCQGTGTSNGGNGSNWIWTYNNTTDGGSDPAKYNGVGFSTKGGSQEYTWGANWWVDKCGLPEGGIAPKNNPVNTHGYTGEFTVVVTAVSTSYVQMVGISASTFQLTKIGA